MRATYFYSKGEKQGKWALNTQKSLPKSHTFKTYLGFNEIPDIEAEKIDIKNVIKRYGNYTLDIDANKEKGQSFNEAITDTRKVVDKLLDLGISEDHFQVFYSGNKGFHINIPAEVIGASDGDPFLALIHKKFDSVLFPLAEFPNLDRSIRSMGMGRMIRITNSKRSDNKLHKVQVTLEELNTFSEEDYKKLAVEPRKCWGGSTPLVANSKLSEMFKRFQAEVLVEQTKKRERRASEGFIFDEFPPCLEKILSSMTKIQEDISFNQICFSCLVPTFKKIGLLSPNDSLQDDRLTYFLDNFEDSTSYTSAIQRIDHFVQCWSDNENTPRAFSCGAMIKASGNDLEICSECPYRLDFILQELNSEYGEMITFEELVKLEEDLQTHKRSQNPFVDNVNKEFTLSYIGSKEIIIQTLKDGRTRFISKNAFETMFDNKRIASVTATGKPNLLNGAVYWLQHPDRDERMEVVFKPDRGQSEQEYNLWRGFSLTPPKTSLEEAYEGCKLYLNHVKNVICGGNEESYLYVMNWLAHLIQKPQEKPGTCLVLKGEEGVGKGTFVRPIMEIIGRAHSLSISHKAHFFSNFNSTLENKILVFLDEAVRASTKAEEGTLKSYISEPTISVEHKGLSTYSLDSYVRVIMASNNEWVVPASKEARRFMVLQVSSENMQDSEVYFKNLYREFENGCASYLLKVLQEWKINIDVRKVVRTEALLQQIEYSLDDVDKFMLEIIEEENFPQAVIDSGLVLNAEGNYVEIGVNEGNIWPDAIKMSVLYSCYVEWRKSQGSTKGLKPRNVFSNRFNRIIGVSDSDSNKVQIRKINKNIKYVRIPFLEKIKEFYDKFLSL